MSDKPTGSLTFGFDIGIASVGWCVLGEKHIVDLGVRCFDKAETAKEGDSLNLARRTARLMRRRLRRRAWRLTKLARLLKREGLIDSIQSIHQPATKSPWQLRVEGLDRKLTPEEWARALYHLCKHRGFYWISKAEEKKAEGDTKSESGKVKTALDNTKRQLNEKGYRSAAEMVMGEFFRIAKDDEGKPKLDKDGTPIFEGRAKNTTNDYSKSLSRVLLGDELKKLFEQQREHSNPHATTELEDAILGNGDRKSGLFWEQKPPLTGKKLLDMLGRCTFERSGGPDGKGECRAPKASFTAERHVWLTKLNNMKIVVDGTTRRLTPEEIKAVLDLPYRKGTEIKYKQFHTFFVDEGLLPASFTFSGLTSKKKDKDPLETTLIDMPAWQKLRKAIQKELKTEWESMAGAAISGNPEQLDQIARVLSVYKVGDEVEHELHKLGLPGGEKMIKTLSVISFDKFHNLSLMALRKIVPHMEAGLRYDEACKKVGYHHSQLHKLGEEGEPYLPPLYEHARSRKPGEKGKMIISNRVEREIAGGIPRNPVVLRALNQARKVCNALLHRYGKPSAIHIEMARDLSRPLDERKKIKDIQDEYQELNKKTKPLLKRSIKTINQRVANSRNTNSIMNNMRNALIASNRSHPTPLCIKFSKLAKQK